RGRGPMRKIWLIAVRDYNATVRTKTFLISLVSLPLLMGGSFVAQALLKEKGGKPRRYAVVDRTPGGGVYPRLEKAVEARNAAAEKAGERLVVLERVEASADTPEAVAEQRLALSDRVRAKEIRGFVEVGPDVEAPGAVRYQSGTALSRDFP